MTDIARICGSPDRGGHAPGSPIGPATATPVGTLRHAWANYRDESFVLQFLSPKVMRDFRMFRLMDATRGSPTLLVDAIHDDQGYREIRRTLARSPTTPA